ncbi:GGDEF domain-containing protein [Candidatus Zixiibacteriota bacterium]
MTNEQVARLRTLLQDLEAVETVDGVFQRLVDGAAELLSAEKVSVVARTETGLLQVRALHWPSVESTEGIAGQVLATGDPILVTDISQDPRLLSFRTARYSSSSFMSVPVVSAGAPVAVLNVTDSCSRAPFTQADLELAGLAAQLAGMSLERHRFLASIDQLQKESVTDALTGLGNRRHFEQRMVSEIGRARRFSQPMSLIMLDIDDFKIYNDTFGHPAGDDALKALSSAMLVNVRSIDDVIRYGGEEFAVILPQTPIDLATVVAERIREAASRIDLEMIHGSDRGHFSVSIGVAAYPRDSRDEEELLNHADIALYMAKTDGKNRVVVFEHLSEDDRRIHRRIPIRLSTVVSGEDTSGTFEEQTMIRNISSGGALISYRRDIVLNTPLQLEIQSPFISLEGAPLSLEIDGSLVREERTEEGLFGAVAFNRELTRFS